ncbi:MAG: 30S ribosomal protein S6 [Parcubacteria group bacterium GW2011_GWB1_41_6]|nr:MAG: 30S ribosomal protein S6 [Parcubacteria group bacterium GW2011_GWB1_41_6]KKS34498.1 MAG: 30S ribosomal protein S6 [Parcubacteria group bacterium GW2011_GWC2_42_13]KKS58213.1 MAG: 30S ribosomal protein S6 [Parcubacteria group bacterium GW2011_GWA2_42_35]KKS70957.1 MAG: 30S ribosomal protein S6 [Parcubacteria group bacterium GW2011_GWF2_42_7]
MGKETNRLYEASYFLSGGLTEEEAIKEDEKIKSIIAKNQALILGEAKPKRQRLAYPVKKSEEAHFGWVRFSAAPEYLKQIKSELSKNNLMIRLLVKIFKNVPPESKIIKPRPQKTTLLAKKPAVSEEAIKPETIKSEEIDKKLEEILGT